MDWDLPGRASTYAADIDGIFYLVAVITTVVFVIVEVALVYFLWKYRGRPGRKAHYTHGNTRAEVIWTAIPAVIVIAIALISARVWSQVKNPDYFPTDGVPVHVAAKQFEWNFTYPGPDGRLGTDDDFTRRNALHVPVDRPVLLTLTAQDVIHSFFIPEFRIKQDAVPGHEIPVWFEATQTGEYELGCAELCGLGHYRMRASVTVHSQPDYERWMASGGADEPAASAPAADAADAAGVD
ncbi:MAG: cytochrome c oxidase subunit II [Gemmatimonadota bacterium]